MADQPLPEVIRAPIRTLTIIEISKSEFEAIEKGSPESVFLTFAVFLLSVAVSFSVTLATMTIASDRTFYVFVIIMTLGYLSGVILLVIWSFSHNSLKSIIKEIRKRLPPEGEQLG